MSGGEFFAAQRTDRIRVLQRFGLATSPLYQNQRDRDRSPASLLAARFAFPTRHYAMFWQQC